MRRDSTISALFVYPDEQWQLVQRKLTERLERLGCVCDAVVESDPERALERIETTAPYQLVVVDLLFPVPPSDRKQQRGLEIVDAVRAKSADTVIVALVRPSEDHGELELRATRAGADIPLQQESLVHGSAYGGTQTLVKEVYVLLCDRGLISPGPDIEDSRDPGVLTAIDDIGEVPIRLLSADLLRETVGEPETIRLSYLTQGSSGAHVLQLGTTTANGLPATWFVKFARDEELLKREVANSRKVQGLYRLNLFITYSSSITRVPFHSGWYAIGTGYARNAGTLRSWLSEAGSERHVNTIMAQLFLNDGLASLYDRPVTDPEEERRAPLRERLTLPPHRRARVRAIVDELGCLLDHPEAAAIDNKADVLRVTEEFSATGRIDSRDLPDEPKRLVLIQSHGDLHTANVLVCAGDPPYPLVIDLAAYKAHHWAYDVSRLIVDIVVRCFDAGAESYLWRRWPVWRELLARVAGLGTVADDPANPAVVAALRWMVDNRTALLPQLQHDDRSWEWHTALAEQLLRRTYNPAVPAPKRVLSLVAAYDQLMLAKQRFPQREQTW